MALPGKLTPLEKAIKGRLLAEATGGPQDAQQRRARRGRVSVTPGEVRVTTGKGSGLSQGPGPARS